MWTAPKVRAACPILGTIIHVGGTIIIKHGQQRLRFIENQEVEIPKMNDGQPFSLFLALRCRE